MRKATCSRKGLLNNIITVEGSDKAAWKREKMMSKSSLKQQKIKAASILNLKPTVK